MKQMNLREAIQLMFKGRMVVAEGICFKLRWDEERQVFMSVPTVGSGSWSEVVDICGFATYRFSELLPDHLFPTGSVVVTPGGNLAIVRTVGWDSEIGTWIYGCQDNMKYEKFILLKEKDIQKAE